MKKPTKNDPKTFLVTAQVATADSMKDYLHETNPEEMSLPEKEILCTLQNEAPELPYPLKELQMSCGKPALAYEIPEEKREEVLKALFPFVECPEPEDVLYDLHERKFFQAKEFIAIRERNRNMLVSPYYASTGGMVVDWIPENSIDAFKGDDDDNAGAIRTFAQETKSAPPRPKSDLQTGPEKE